MKVIVRFSAKQEAKALPLLLRHSPGMLLPDRVYILSEEAILLLRQEGIKFTEIGKESEAPSQGGTLSGERI